MPIPLITVVTVCRNAERHIEQTIVSVLHQTWPSLEYIVVDGASTDGTLSVVDRFRQRIDHVISEKDEGIADAMNKGLGLASGDYLVFLHADDYFKNDRALEEAVLHIGQNVDILACSIDFGKQRKLLRPRGFNPWMKFKTGVFHQGAICRRTLLEKLGGFDKQFRIVMDYDFFLRAYQARARLIKAPVTLAVMRDTGVSTREDWTGLKARFDEERRVHEKNCRSVYMRRVYQLYWVVYLLYRRTKCMIKNRGLIYGRR